MNKLASLLVVVIIHLAFSQAESLAAINGSITGTNAPPGGQLTVASGTQVNYAGNASVTISQDHFVSPIECRLTVTWYDPGGVNVQQDYAAKFVARGTTEVWQLISTNSPQIPGDWQARMELWALDMTLDPVTGFLVPNLIQLDTRTLIIHVQ